MNNIFGTKFPQGYVNLVLRDELYRMRMMIQHTSAEDEVIIPTTDRGDAMVVYCLIRAEINMICSW